MINKTVCAIGHALAPGRAFAQSAADAAPIDKRRALTAGRKFNH